MKVVSEEERWHFELQFDPAKEVCDEEVNYFTCAYSAKAEHIVIAFQS